MLNPSIQGTDKQDKSQLTQRNDTLTIFPHIKSTKNYPTMCVGLYTKNPTNVGVKDHYLRLPTFFPHKPFAQLS